MNKAVPAAIIILSGTVIASVLLFVPPIPQNPSYHFFADRRSIFDIPNFFNVVSNLPFLIVGLMGIGLVFGKSYAGGLPELRNAYFIFFMGVSLVGLGSAHYHLNPDTETLFWDRLPMTIAFMAFFSIIIGENISIEAGKRLLYPIIIAGALSILYWFRSEQQGQGDLRFYALVQFLPMLLIPIMLAAGQSRFSSNGYLWAFLDAYALSKLAEYADHGIYRWSGTLSGHSVKHLLAATGVWFFYLGLKKRVRTEKSIYEKPFHNSTL